MDNQNSPEITFGQFTGHYKLGTSIILEWQKTTIFAPEFAKIMQAIWPMARDAYTTVEIDFLRAHPEVVNISDNTYEGFYKPFEPLFKNVLKAVDWGKAELIMQELLKSHFIFDASTWGPEIVAMFAQDVCYGITVKDQQTGKLLGFITFMMRPSYTPGDIKVMTSGVEQAYQKHNLDKLLMGSILRINQDIKRICTGIRVTNTDTLKTYRSWGFAHTDNPIEDHTHNHKHWIFLEYKTETSHFLQDTAKSLITAQ